MYIYIFFNMSISKVFFVNSNKSEDIPPDIRL